MNENTKGPTLTTEGLNIPGRSLIKIDDDEYFILEKTKQLLLEVLFKNGESMEYPKIQSLWKREGWYFDENKKKDPKYQSGRQSFIIGDYASEEFANIKKWHVDEKVDGTNIRIFYKDSKVWFEGRTSKAQLPPKLLKYLQDHFTIERMKACFPNLDDLILFGEGYGPNIQSGGNYRKEIGFILFDTKIVNWWLKREDVEITAQNLEIPVVPSFGIMREEEIVDLVKSKPLSKCSEIDQVIEGVVCRSEPLMLYRNGNPIKFKLKCKEFN